MILKASLQPWTVQHSRYLHRDKWLSVRADDCVTASGVEVSPYYVIECPDFVHVVALDISGNVLLVRQYRHGLRGLSLELPAGRLEPGETDVLGAAARELGEETQYGAKRLKQIGNSTASAARFGNTIHTVLAEDCRPLAIPSPEDPTEDIQLELVPISKALELAMAGEILDASHISSLILGLSKAGKLRLSASRN
jgi:8-oxo-dGTP pyrophosphatase MutT (NUDIX family)